MAVSRATTQASLDRGLLVTLAVAVVCGGAAGYIDSWQSGIVVAAAIYVLAHELRSQRDVRATLVGLVLLFALVAYGVALVLLKSVGKSV
jgi:hypothetical protein